MLLFSLIKSGQCLFEEHVQQEHIANLYRLSANIIDEIVKIPLLIDELH